MRATVKDVARRAGVSPKTVSNVVNGTFSVSPATRGRVERALLELDYVPNLSARGLRNGRTGVIVLALPAIAAPYGAETIHHFVAAAGERGLNVQIEETACVEREAELLSRARAQLVDGLILNPVLLETTAVRRGVSLPPMVLIGEVNSPLVDHVWVDNVAACRELTTRLIRQGHRRFVLVGTSESATSRLRVQGHLEALAAAGLEHRVDHDVSTSSWTAGGGAQAILNHLQHHDLPDAIVCMTDSIAQGVLGALWSQGHRVPEDVSVVGYDDIEGAAYTVPPLTTIGFDRRAIADEALTLLTGRIADSHHPPTSVVVPYTIVERGSTQPRE